MTNGHIVVLMYESVKNYGYNYGHSSCPEVEGATEVQEHFVGNNKLVAFCYLALLCGVSKKGAIIYTFNYCYFCCYFSFLS